MAEGKKSFMFYCDWKDTFDALPDDKAGQLVKHLLSYVNDENPETDDILINAVFANIKATLKRDLKKWEAKSNKNRESANKRWQKENANACERIKRNAKNADSDKDKVKDINIYSEDVFLENWSKCRQHYLKQPTGIKNLNFPERNALNEALKNYTKEEINEAMITLFQQEKVLNESMRLRPQHFLEKIDTYFTGIGNKKIWGK